MRSFSSEWENLQILVTYLYKNVKNSQRYDYCQKDGCSKANREYRGDHGKKGSEEWWDTSGYHIINDTYILGEAVHDSPLGGGLKEWHGWVHDVDQHSLMKMPWRYSRSSCQGQGLYEHKQALREAKSAINTKEKIAFLVWSYIRGAPPCEPNSGRDSTSFGHH